MEKAKSLIIYSLKLLHNSNVEFKVVKAPNNSEEEAVFVAFCNFLLRTFNTELKVGKRVFKHIK